VSLLEVPGAHLYYETRGNGPVLLMVPGANGVADGFRMITEHLAERFTVVLYDRRGFSRSRLDGPQDYSRRLETVALELLTRHPSVVRTLVPYEPPAVRLLPDGQRWLDFFAGVYDTYRRLGIDPALAAFRERSFAEVDRRLMAHAPRNDANAAYWFEHELGQYPATELDLDVLATHADRIVLAVGRESHSYPCREVNVELGAKLGREVVELPGGHVGPVAHPAEFAHELVRALDQPVR
jgi:acetyltransferase/esterase